MAPRKKRASGKFAVFSVAKVAAGEGQLVDVLVPESPVFASSREAERAARELAESRDGARLSVHRILAAFTVQSVTKRTLVRD